VTGGPDVGPTKWDMGHGACGRSGWDMGRGATRGRAGTWDVRHTARAYGEVRVGVRYTNLPSRMV
jgi:hypothetical protein